MCQAHGGRCSSRSTIGGLVILTILDEDPEGLQRDAYIVLEESNLPPVPPVNQPASTLPPGVPGVEMILLVLASPPKGLRLSMGVGYFWRRDLQGHPILGLRSAIG